MARQSVHWEEDGESGSFSQNELRLPANRRASTIAPSGTTMRKETSERLMPLPPAVFNLSDHPDWPPDKRAATPWDLPEDGRLDAPRNAKVCTRFARESVFERLALRRQSDDNKNAREVSVMSRRGAGGRIFLGANGNVVKKQEGKEGMHGGFKEQAVHHVLASRFRWRHACAEALAFGKDDEEEAEASISLRAHNTFAVVARAAMKLGNMSKRLVKSEGQEEQAMPEALHESAAQTATTIFHLPSAKREQQHPAQEKALTPSAAHSPGSRGGASPGPLSPLAGPRAPMLRMRKGASDTSLGAGVRSALGSGVRTPKDATPSRLEWRRDQGETWTPPAFTGKVSALVAWEKAARARALPAIAKH